MREKGGPRILGGAELIQMVLDEERKVKDLEPSDPNHPFGFEFDEEAQIWTIWWGGYEYWFHQKDVASPESLLQWIEHLTEKDWPSMTPYKLNRFIANVRSKWEQDAV